jgi:spore germination cell wall hydrolase CwlJ-like protein
MTIQDQVVLALTCWRENRAGGYRGMQSVANVILNRASHRGTSVYAECTRPLQFSSLTVSGDPELHLWPLPADAQWSMAMAMAELAAQGGLQDLTGGAVLYYAPRGIVTKLGKTFTLPDGTVVPFPDDWNQAVVTFTVEIANQIFFK